MKSLYVEGRTPLHRLSVRVKLAGLFTASLLVFFLSTPFFLAACLLLALGLLASLRLSPREILARLGWLTVSILFVALLTSFFDGPEAGIVSALRFLTLVVLATAVTSSTELGDFMDEILRLLRPLDRIGLLKAQDVALAFGLVLRFVPEILTRYAAIREAHRARGLQPRLSTLIVPLIILTLKDADSVALAIDARALRRQ
ncbi:energy-coupling factor transporter transmembrane component T family protein [Rhizobium sp. YIM 134829]|uniref:energy-coupling factor transporter transmembrane component T family protein n=1 Tax=Rhizobium sp. YIM 134829 TaxID=3390453 RepID=UPI00397831B7